MTLLENSLVAVLEIFFFSFYSQIHIFSVIGEVIKVGNIFKRSLDKKNGMERTEGKRKSESN